MDMYVVVMILLEDCPNFDSKDKNVKYTNNHSKYLISGDDDNYYVGFGDLNRMYSLWCRAGSYLIINDKNLHESMKDILDTCESID